MRLWAFSRRNIQEILRDPLNLFFGLAFPLALLLLMQAIERNIPAEIFAIERLAPGVAVFGLSFMTLFSSMLIARDRESALLHRLYTTPLTAPDFILGYTLPILPLCLGQTAVCYLVSLAFGLPGTMRVFDALALSLPIGLLYTALGMLCGSALRVSQVGGVCGALITNLSAWLSGTWFDLSLVGGIFEKAANLLPFVHAVALQRAALNGSAAEIGPHLLWTLGYAIPLLAAAIWCFLRRMKRS